MHDAGKATLPDIVKVATFKAPIEKVWKAVATADGIASWLMPNDFKPAAGQDFTLLSPVGPVPCKVTEIDPPARLSFDWDTFGWHVTFKLEETAAGTQLTLIHGGWSAPGEIIPRVGQTHAAIHEVMNNGWEPNINESLRKVIEG